MKVLLKVSVQAARGFWVHCFPRAWTVLFPHPAFFFLCAAPSTKKVLSKQSTRIIQMLSAIPIKSNKYPHIPCPFPWEFWPSTLAVWTQKYSHGIAPYAFALFDIRRVSSFFLCRKLKLFLFHRSLSGMIKLASKEWDLTERRPTGFFNHAREPMLHQ